MWISCSFKTLSVFRIHVCCALCKSLCYSHELINFATRSPLPCLPSPLLAPPPTLPIEPTLLSQNRSLSRGHGTPLMRKKDEEEEKKKEKRRGRGKKGSRSKRGIIIRIRYPSVACGLGVATGEEGHLDKGNNKEGGRRRGGSRQEEREKKKKTKKKSRVLHDETTGCVLEKFVMAAWPTGA